MFDKEMFGSRKDKVVHIILVGANGVSPSGTVIGCSDRFLTLSTRWSNKQHVALEQIASFWFEEDKPEF